MVVTDCCLLLDCSLGEAEKPRVHIHLCFQSFDNKHTHRPIPTTTTTTWD